MEQGKLAQLLEANNKYNKDLSKYLKGTLPKKNFLNLGQPHGALAEHIGNSQDLLMRQGILTKAVKGHKTPINLKQVEDLPFKLYQAKQIFKSKKDGSLVAVLDVKDSANNSVVVTIDVNQKINNRREESNVSTITSIYGKPALNIERWQQEGLELHSVQNKEKTSTYSKQLDLIPSVGINEDLNDVTKLAQENQTTKSMAEKMSELTEKTTEAATPKTLEVFTGYALALQEQKNKKYLAVKGEEALVLPNEAWGKLSELIQVHASEPAVTEKQVDTLLKHSDLLSRPESTALFENLLRTEYAKQHNITEVNQLKTRRVNPEKFSVKEWFKKVRKTLSPKAWMVKGWKLAKKLVARYEHSLSKITAFGKMEKAPAVTPQEQSRQSSREFYAFLTAQKQHGLALQKFTEREKYLHSKPTQLEISFPAGTSEELNNTTKVVRENQKSLAEKMSELTQKNTAALRAKLPQQPPHKHKHYGKSY
ncbi:MAG: hypothetical protein LBK47_06625 [Prevotellaceae bacterium]|jgi:hypothetical protein|nr:hypothetical protein [Prevotellaceae bacterium]